MPTYRVKPGKFHGPRNEYGPGDLVEHTEYEASGFLDKLELVVEEPPAPDEPEIPTSEGQSPEPIVPPPADKPKGKGGKGKGGKGKPAAEPVIPAPEPAEPAETKAGE